MDSVHWREWDLLGLSGGVDGFLIVHAPLLLVIFYDVIALNENLHSGLIISLIISLSGFFAFGIHSRALLFISYSTKK